MLFGDWESLLRVLAIGLPTYAGLVVLLRVSGNRTLSKMNSFDLVVTIAFGSTLSTILINKNVSLASGLSAIALLVLLQLVITWLSVRFAVVNRLIKSQPVLLIREGQFLHASMKKVRITEDEIRSAIRQQGLGGIEEVAAAVLETDGSVSVIAVHRQGSLNALEDVKSG